LHPGSYVLIISIEEEVEITVGALGPVTFSPGLYTYCGSAQGGLEQRVGRHFSKEKKKHWHVDHLLGTGELMSALLLEGDDNECRLNRYIASLPGSQVVCLGFGSSDCKCPAHLYLIDESSLPLILNEMRWLQESPGSRKND
jgi:Uri superfamily endonuclease